MNAVYWVSRHSFVTDLTFVEPLLLTRHEGARLSRPFLMSTTSPKGLRLRGRFSSQRSTRSFALIFLWRLSHSCISWSAGNYFFTQRFQNKSSRYWTWRLHRLQYEYSYLVYRIPLLGLSNTPTRRLVLGRSNSSMFWVSGSGCRLSSLIWHIGRLFSTFSTPVTRIENDSPFKSCSLIIDLITSLLDSRRH